MSGGKKIEINQLLAGFARDDAISNYARRLRSIFESWGHPSRIFVDPSHLDPALKNEAAPLDRSETPGRQVLIYHFSIGSPATDFFLAARGKRAVIYHNITPPDFFHHFDPDAAARLTEGRRQLAGMAAAVDLALADSEYNRRELAAAGFRRAAVLPIPLDPAALSLKPAARILRRLGRRRDHVIFVGRVAPNKKIEDLLRFFHYYSRACRPEAKLILVGKYKFTDRYFAYLSSLLPGHLKDKVLFAGQAPQAEMIAYYRRAGVFVSMSEHEGFGLPLLESMFLGVPVMAYAAAAVPETMGGAGVLFTRKDYPALAEMASLLVEDEKLRGAILEGQRRRIESFLAVSTAGALKAALAPWLETGA